MIFFMEYSAMQTHSGAKLCSLFKDTEFPALALESDALPTALRGPARKKKIEMLPLFYYHSDGGNYHSECSSTHEKAKGWFEMTDFIQNVTMRLPNGDRSIT